MSEETNFNYSYRVEINGEYYLVDGDVTEDDEHIDRDEFRDCVENEVMDLAHEDGRYHDIEEILLGRELEYMKSYEKDKYADLIKKGLVKEENNE